MKTSIVIAIVAVLIGGALWIGLSDDESTDTATDQSSPQQSVNQSTDSDENASAELSTFSVEEVAVHNQSDDCWTVIDDKVYDITSYVPRHPGGDEILLACGTDGSSLFNDRTTEDGQTIGSGTAHSTNASRQLDGFLIGNLKVN